MAKVISKKRKVLVESNGEAHVTASFNNIIISKEGSRKTYRISPSVPQVIFGLEKVNNQVCDYRINK